MPADFRQFDEHGLPLPPRFSDLKNRDDEAPSRPKISLRAKRLTLLAVFLCLIALFFGPQIVSGAWEILSDWLSTRAAHKFFEGDYAGALSDLNQAVYCNPNAWECYQLRANVRAELGDLSGSLNDYNHLIEILDAHDGIRNRVDRSLDRAELLADAYAQRSWVYVRLNRGREAIDDANQAVHLMPSPVHLNARAYARAMVHMELREGLADVEKALADSNPNNSDFLDTRGYLLYLLDRPDEALKDLDPALKTMERARRGLLLRQNVAGQRVGLRERNELDRGLAVMYHHRGLVYEKMGRKEEAALDLKRGDDLGYNPDRGVF